MQCHEMRYSDISLLSPKVESNPIKTEKEAIHSGHFMVSHFEAEAQDDEYEVAVPVPEMRDAVAPQSDDLQVFNVKTPHKAIETSLTKLFQCMSLAYRQKLTSPKWNRFKGIRLRWKDKIRLNNVIWRCWHMQFIKRENTLVCQFASPLDEGTHNKPEAVVLEGKYWKRKLAAVTAEYKRWRMFYRNKIMGWANKDTSVPDMDMFDWQSQSTDSSQLGTMMVDEDYMELMSDTLFSTITSNQPFAFPDTREIAKGANLADFIQPSLVQLQPNLDDFMDTFEPFQEMFISKLPPVPEDCPVPDLSYRSAQSFPDLTLENQIPALPQQELTQPNQSSYQSVVSYSEPVPAEPPTDPKAAGYYQKQRSQHVYPPGEPPYVCQESILLNPPVGQNYNEANQRTFPGKVQQLSQQQSFKMPSNSKVFKYPQYQKSQFGRSQNFDLSSQETMMPELTGSQGMIKGTLRSSSLPSVNKSEAFVVPKQQPMINLKSRQRTRSGSSLVMVKTKPPPLSTANSDSAINISSALLAQLLTTSKPKFYNKNNSGVYNITNAPDRVQTTQPVLKSTNIPIMPSPAKAQHQKLLPMTHANTLLITDPALTTTQGYMSSVTTIRPSSSPESPSDCTRVQNLPSPGRLSQSPTSPLIYAAPISPSSSQKQDNSLKSASGSNEHRRVCHINAEQKRRYNIKNGFDVLHSLIPHLNLNPNVKLSKAVMLQKGAEYIRQLQAERLRAQEDMEALKYQIESLNTSISNCQSMLPATGAPVSHHRTTKMKEMFDDFVRLRTAENWKFWIFSVLFQPLLQSFNCSVSTASYEDLYRSTLIWVEQHCSLVELRPTVLNSLRNLCTTTEILSNPSKLPEEARAAVNKKKIGCLPQEPKSQSIVFATGSPVFASQINAFEKF